MKNFGFLFRHFLFNQWDKCNELDTVSFIHEKIKSVILLSQGAFDFVVENCFAYFIFSLSFAIVRISL